MESETPNETGGFMSFFTNGSKKLTKNVKAAANAAGRKWNESSTVTKACVVGVPAAVAAPLLIIPALSAVGFTSAGVAAGSIAASLQTATTASGSIFALCQSAGATGVVATSTSVGVGLTGGLTTGGITAAIFGKKTPKQVQDKGVQTGDDGNETEVISEPVDADTEQFMKNNKQTDMDAEKSQEDSELVEIDAAMGEVTESTSTDVGSTTGSTIGNITARIFKRKPPMLFQEIGVQTDDYDEQCRIVKEEDLQDNGDK